MREEAGLGKADLHVRKQPDKLTLAFYDRNSFDMKKCVSSRGVENLKRNILCRCLPNKAGLSRNGCVLPLKGPSILLLVSWICFSPILIPALFGGEPSFVRLVSPLHPLYEIETRAYAVDLKKVASSRQYSVSDNRTFEENFESIVVWRRLLTSGLDGIKPREVYDRNVIEAYELYPGNPVINVLYANTLFFKFNDRLAEVICILASVVQEAPAVPALAREFNQIFSSYIDNWSLMSSTQRHLKYLHEIFGASDLQQLKNDIELLGNYWGALVNLEYEDAESRKYYQNCARKMAELGGREKALAVWKKVLCNSFAHEARKKATIRQDIGNEAQVAPTQVQVNSKKKTAKEEEVAAILKEMEENRSPLDMNWLECYVTCFRIYRIQLQDQPDLPNLDALKRIYTNPDDALILNLWYKMAVHGAAKDVMEQLQNFPNWEKDERLVYLKLHCLRELKADKKTMLPLVEKLIQINPGSKMYKHLKLSIEKMD